MATTAQAPPPHEYRQPSALGAIWHPAGSTEDEFVIFRTTQDPRTEHVTHILINFCYNLVGY
jgi:hypothetical protein